MLKQFVFLILLLLPCWGIAQSDKQTKIPIEFSIAYTHSGTSNPGLQFGADWVFKELVTQKKKKVRNLGEYTVERKRQIALESRLGFYWDPFSHVAVFNQYLLSFRFLFQRPGPDRPQWNMAIGFGPGYQQNLLPEVYEVDANNQVKDLGVAGRGYLSTVFDFRVARERKEKRLNAWFFGLNTVWLFDYNATIAPINSLFFGFRFKLKPQS